MRRAVAALATLVALVGLTACGGSAPAPAPAPPPGPLRILLVNDDGWNAPGSVAMRDALRRAGHRVVQVAPVTDRSSAGTATTTTGELVVRRPSRDPDVYTVSGTASDAVLVARTIMLRDPPQLFVAGVDSTPTLGIDSLRAGSVGAGMVAAALDIPAITVSTFVVNRAAARPADFRRPVDFAVRLVRTLQEQQTPRLLGRGTVLNVNYPGTYVAAPRSVTAAPTSNAPTVDVSYRPGRGADRYVATARPLGTAAADGVDDDVNAFWKQGDVTLTDLTADPDRASPPSERTAARIAPLMKP